MLNVLVYFLAWLGSCVNVIVYKLMQNLIMKMIHFQLRSTNSNKIIFTCWIWIFFTYSSYLHIIMIVQQSLSARVWGNFNFFFLPTTTSTVATPLIILKLGSKYIFYFTSDFTNMKHKRNELTNQIICFIIGADLSQELNFFVSFLRRFILRHRRYDFYISARIFVGIQFPDLAT